jgi:hypothetical protein
LGDKHIRNYDDAFDALCWLRGARVVISLTEEGDTDG